jgi:hypothetical protein
LGKSLRAQYHASPKSIPVKLVQLLRRLDEAHATDMRPSPAAPRATDDFDPLSFDPETLSILCTALEEGCRTVSDIGNQTITRDELARRLMELVPNERKPGMLAARAIISLLLPSELENRTDPARPAKKHEGS